MARRVIHVFLIAALSIPAFAAFLPIGHSEESSNKDTQQPIPALSPEFMQAAVQYHKTHRPPAVTYMDLADESSCVVRGRVDSHESYTLPDGTINTRHQFSVTEKINGYCEDAVEVETVGGMVGNIIMEATHHASFGVRPEENPDGKEFIVFLKRQDPKSANEKPRFGIINEIPDALMPIVEEDGAEKVWLSDRTVSSGEFVKKLKDHLELRKTNGKQADSFDIDPDLVAGPRVPSAHLQKEVIDE